MRFFSPWISVSSWLFVATFIAAVAGSNTVGAIPIGSTPIQRPTVSANARFGQTIAVWDRWMAVGAPWDDLNGSQDQGSVHLYERTGNEWIRRAALTTPTPDAGALFGHGLAMEDRWLVVGAPGAHVGGLASGSAFIFERSDTGWWAYRHAMSSAVPQEGAQFGNAVAMTQSSDGHFIGVGAYTYDWSGVADSGMVELWANSYGPTFTRTTSFGSPSAAVGDRFGVSIAMAPFSMLVGEYGDDTRGVNAGAAHLYRMRYWRALETNTGYVETIYADDTSPNIFFGYSTALDGRRGLIGSYGEESNAGAAYSLLVEGTANNFTVSKDTLLAPISNGDDFFGATVALRDGRIAVSALELNTDGPNTQPGRVEAFARNDGESIDFTHLGTMTPPQGTAGAQTGVGLAIWGDTMFVGAPDQSGELGSGGAVYVCPLPPMQPNVPVALPELNGIRVAVSDHDRQATRRQIIPAIVTTQGENAMEDPKSFSQNLMALGVNSTSDRDYVDFFARGTDGAWRLQPRLTFGNPQRNVKGVHLVGDTVAVSWRTPLTNEQGTIEMYNRQPNGTFGGAGTLLDHRYPFSEGFGRMIAFHGNHLVSNGSEFGNYQGSFHPSSYFRTALNTWGNNASTRVILPDGAPPAHYPGADMVFAGDVLAVISPYRVHEWSGRDVDFFQRVGNDYTLLQTMNIDVTSLLRRTLAIGDGFLIPNGEESSRFVSPNAQGVFEIRGDIPRIDATFGDVGFGAQGSGLNYTTTRIDLYRRSGADLEHVGSAWLELMTGYNDQATLDFYLTSDRTIVVATNSSIIWEFDVAPRPRYHAYVGTSPSGPFTRATTSPLEGPSILLPPSSGPQYVYVTAVGENGVESAPSAVHGPVSVASTMGIAVR